MRILTAPTAAALLVLCHHGVNAGANMNGEYKISNSETYSTEYANTEFFEVYSPPIKTLYSQVFWRMQDPVPLPRNIVERFANGKVMAITGYEVDQVGTSPTGEDVPVPITWAYNHHYCAWVSGGGKNTVTMTKFKGGRVGHGHGHDEHWEPVLTQVDPNPSSNVPLSHFFSEGNGGEFRKSYHGYPKGYAQLLESPNTFHINPMQIDSWNRNGVLGPPLPKSSRIPESAGYSGLIECPCSDKLQKEWHMTYALQEENQDKCAAPIQNATECFQAARQVVPSKNYVQKKISSSSPKACIVQPHADGSTDVIWNDGQDHGDDGAISLEDKHENDSSLNHVIAFASAVVNVTVELSKERDEATITMVGPASKWFGVGFGADTMCIHADGDECPTGGPYAIVISGDEVEERKLDFHGPGTVLKKSVTVQSSTIDNGIQTVVLSRPLKGATSSHYSFDVSTTQNSPVPIIAATGCDLVFAKHCGHGPATLNFLAVDTPTRVCQAGIEGSIGGNKFDNKRCAPWPTSDLAVQHNPTCGVQTYRGGLSCCRDGQSLLDADQEIPWPDQYLEYRLKFRFYFEEYFHDTAEAPSHLNLIRLYWTTEAFAGEYDIVQCEDGVHPDQCIQVITSQFKVRDMLHDCSTRPDGGYCTGVGSTNANVTQGIQLIYAGPHCHAPTCLSMELYNADTGRLLCSVEPVHGKGKDGLYDEKGFLAIPPCLWGDESEGLQAPELLPLDTNLLSIKRNNNTLGHTGEMASWQMRGVVVPKPKLKENKVVTERFRSGRLRRAQDGAV